MIPEFPGRGHGATWARFFFAAFAVISLTAAATATGALLGVKGFVDDLKHGRTIKGTDGIIAPVAFGRPQTLLLIGSDHRYDAAKNDARSDTMMLVRLDADANAITVLSIPRDLKVTYTDLNGALHSNVKINQTYSDGGEALTAKVITKLLGVRVNHIININFGGFREAVNAIGCVYVDVDHRYFHQNLPGGEQYAEIDVPPGYQKLCGQKALDYVRFRHTDSDFIRAARQQDFLRQLKSQYGVGDFMNDPHKITRILGRYSTTDAQLQSTDAVLKLINLAAGVAGKPVRQVEFPASVTMDHGISFVEATPDQVAQARSGFLAPAPADPGADAATGAGSGAPRQGAVRQGAGRRAGAKQGGGATTASGPATIGLTDASSTGASYAIRLGDAGFPVYYPKLLTTSGQYEAPLLGAYPRAYRIKDQHGKMRRAYRLVIRTPEAGNYYGIQGTTWTDPPILRNPSADSPTVNGKKLMLYYDGKRLRTVAWRSGRAVYWVENTLQARLTNQQMLQIAGSLTRLGR